MIKEIYARCPEMFTAASELADEDWFAAKAHTHERHKFTLFPSIEVLAKFRDYHVGGIGIERQDVAHGDLKRAPLEKIPLKSQSKKLFRVSAAYDMALAKKILKTLQSVVSVQGCSEEFLGIFLENMVDTPDNGG